MLKQEFLKSTFQCGPVFLHADSSCDGPMNVFTGQNGQKLPFLSKCIHMRCFLEGMDAEVRQVLINHSGGGYLCEADPEIEVHRHKKIRIPSPGLFDETLSKKMSMVGRQCLDC